MHPIFAHLLLDVDYPSRSLLHSRSGSFNDEFENGCAGWCNGVEFLSHSEILSHSIYSTYKHILWPITQRGSLHWKWYPIQWHIPSIQYTGCPPKNYRNHPIVIIWMPEHYAKPLLILEFEITRITIKVKFQVNHKIAVEVPVMVQLATEQRVFVVTGSR